MKEKRIEGKNYYFTSTKPFLSFATLKDATVLKVFDFAYKMTFGNEGQHRNHRSGGTHQRRLGEIFADTFQGKLSEFAIYNTLYKNFEIQVPDLSVWELGKWDDVDLIADGMRLSIKSTKSFGQLLLLETKDWDSNGNYLPNIEKNEGQYDAFILVRMNPYCADILKKLKAYFSDNVDYEILKNEICSQKWSYDIPGFIWNDELKHIISNNMIIHRGDLLNGKTQMDAENYYVQSGDLHPIEKLKRGKNGKS